MDQSVVLTVPKEPSRFSLPWGFELELSMWSHSKTNKSKNYIGLQTFLMPWQVTFNYKRSARVNKRKVTSFNWYTTLLYEYYLDIALE